MPRDPVSADCGCAFFLAVLAVYVGSPTAWAFLEQTGLVYHLAVGLAAWAVATVYRRVRR
jgi:hypothetical protein